MTPNEIDIGKIILILRSHALLIAGIFIAVMLVTGAITYQTPRIYEANATLNFDFGSNYPLDDRGRSNSMLVQSTYITTQVGIIKSKSLAQQVVNSLTDYEFERLVVALNNENAPIDLWVSRLKKAIKSSLFSGGNRKGNEGGPGKVGVDETLAIRRPYTWVAGAISSSLDVAPIFNTRLVKVTYFSADPEIAALIAERFAEAYIDTNLKMMVNPAQKSKVWFDDQLKVLRVRLEEAQQQLTSYQQIEGIVSADERIDMETSRLNNLANQLVVAQQATRNAETGKQKLEEVRNKGASLMTFEPVFSNSVVQKIKTDIRSLDGQLVEYSNSLGVNHPKIKKLKSEIAASRKRLAAEIQTITYGIENATALSKERERDLEQEMRKQKQLVLKLKNEHDKIAILKREVDSAHATYNAALDQLNTTSMQSLADQPSASIVDHAGVPGTHFKPQVMKNLAIGAFGGLLLGIGLAVFLAVFIRRVHSKEDLISELGVPLLLGHLKKV